MGVIQSLKHPRVSKILILLAVTGTFLIFHLPLHRSYLFGDDALLVNDALHPNGSNSLIGEFFLVGGGKWRPISTPILLAMSRHFKYDLVPFQIVSMTVFVLAVLIVGLMVWRVTEVLTPPIIIVVLSISSPFTWLIQSWTYGLMESLALLLTTLAVALFVLIITRKQFDQNLFYIASFSIFLATLTHERYLIVVLALWAFFAFHPGTIRRLQQSAWVLMAIPGIHVFVKGILLGINPITSGGEGADRISVGLWIVGHLLKGLSGVFGGLGGAGFYYSQGQFATMANAHGASPIYPIVISTSILATILTAVVFQFKRRENLNPKKVSTSIYCGTLLVWIGLALLVPGALVPERFEGRWLLGPQIFLFAGIALLANDFVVLKKFRLFVATCICGILLFTNWHYRQQADDFFVFRSQVDSALQQLESRETRIPWFAMVYQTDASSPVPWQFGYGNAFSQLENPPYRFGFSTKPECPVFRKSITCYVIEIDGIKPTAHVYESK